MPQLWLLWLLLSIPGDGIAAADVQRFPSEAECVKAMAFNRRHEDYLELRQQWEGERRWYYWQQLREENDRIYSAWWSLRNCWQAAYKLDALRLLRERIGEELYEAGAMPGPIPRGSLWED